MLMNQLRLLRLYAQVVRTYNYALKLTSMNATPAPRNLQMLQSAASRSHGKKTALEKDIRVLSKQHNK